MQPDPCFQNQGKSSLLLASKMFLLKKKLQQSLMWWCIVLHVCGVLLLYASCDLHPRTTGTIMRMGPRDLDVFLLLLRQLFSCSNITCPIFRTFVRLSTCLLTQHLQQTWSQNTLHFCITCWYQFNWHCLYCILFLCSTSTKCNDKV